MMKKYLVLSVLTLMATPLIQGKTEIQENQLVTAIKDIDRSTVLSLLNKEGITHRHKKEELLKTAKDSVTHCKKSLTWLRSWKDSLAALFGAHWLVEGATSLGGFTLHTFFRVIRHDEERDAYYIGKSLALTALGGYLFHKGWNLGFASHSLEEAERIEDLISKTPVT